MFDAELQALAQQVVTENARLGCHVTTAESCTGGLVAAAITAIAGASDILERAYVTYANSAKTGMLGVRPDTLARFGAVSVETAEEMARGALLDSEADTAVAISGIAGPGGGSADKPVGTVAFARARRNGGAISTMSEIRHFGADGERDEIRRLATVEALRLLLPLEP